VCFVPAAERAEREQVLRDAGVMAVVGSWTEVEAMLCRQLTG
jgi:hypothetical protein